jgi:hypothetical protein
MKSEVGITQELPGEPLRYLSLCPPSNIMIRHLVPVKRVGAADIIGFGQDGVTILRNTFRPEPRLAIKDFGYNDGWHVEKHVRIVGDTTGNGLADIIGFGDAGVLVSRNNGNGTFGPPGLALRNFGADAGGWTNAKHVRYAADLRKKGFVDLIGFGDAGVFVALNNGNGNFAPAKLVLKDFGYVAGGWKAGRHLRFLADTTGDGLPDIVGFGESSVFVSFNNGDGTFQPVKEVVNDFTHATGGWRMDKHTRTVANLSGDGRVDILGFGEDGVYVALNIGNGTFQPVKHAIQGFGYNNTWRVGMHPRFVADTTGDGLGDIVGFGSGGVYVARNNGDGTFATATIVLYEFGYDHGWRVDKHPRFLADLTGNGAVDIVGFGEDAVWVSYNDGKGNFPAAVKIATEFAFNDGQWAVDKTVRWVSNMF